MRLRLHLGFTRRCLAGAFGAAIVEAGYAAAASVSAHATSSVLPVASEAFATVLVPSVALALLVGALFDAPAVQRTERGIAASLPPGSPLLACGLLALAAVAARSVARSAQQTFTVNVTVTLALVAAASVLLVGAPLVVLGAEWARPRLAHLERRASWVHRLSIGPAPAAVAGWLLVLGVRRLFPPAMLPPLVGAVTAFASASRAPGRSLSALALRGGHGRTVVASALAASALTILALPRVPAAGRAILLYRSPLVGVVLGAARALVDRDQDGYSPILLGGDCDDHDPHVNPGATDLPGNGLDENCSGADATSYTPYRQPAFVPPVMPARPNVVVVMLDALRPDHLHFAGYRRQTSPNLDAFRENATWFRNAYTPGASTRFALASIMTGLDVASIPQNRGPQDLDLLPGTRVLGQRLTEQGYDTVGYTISYVTQHIRGVGQGFRVWGSPWPDEEWEKNFSVSATKTTDAALAYLAGVPDAPGKAGKPFFLFVHYQCTHQPYARNDRWVFGDSSLDDYDSGLAYCDDELGRLFAALRARPDAAHTATFLFSDHGELFDEHGLTEHGNSVFQPDVRTVLLAHLPFLPRVREVDTPVSLLDLEPTWLSLAGAVNPQSRGWNLLPLLERGDAAGDRQRPIYLYTDLTRGTVRHEVHGVLEGRLKYVRDLSAGTTELYDVVTDPKEDTDVSASSPRERAHLAELLEGWEHDTARP